MVVPRPLAHTSLSKFTFDDLIMFSVGNWPQFKYLMRGKWETIVRTKVFLLTVYTLKSWGILIETKVMLWPMFLLQYNLVLQS